MRDLASVTPIREPDPHQEIAVRLADAIRELRQRLDARGRCVLEATLDDLGLWVGDPDD